MVSEGACKTIYCWNKTHQSWLRAKLVIEEFLQHYPDLRDYYFVPFGAPAGEMSTGCGRAVDMECWCPAQHCPATTPLTAWDKDPKDSCAPVGLLQE